MAVEHKRAFDGGLLKLKMVFHKAGDVVKTHAHTIDHLSEVVRGVAKIEHGDECDIAKEDDSVWILRGVPHRITALKDNTCVYCLIAVPDDNGVVFTRDRAMSLTEYDVIRLTGAL